MEDNEVQIPQLGGIGKLTPEEIQSILGAVKDNFSGIRNDAGQYTVDYKRLRDIRNYNLAPDVRAAKAIVSPTGTATGGDFTDPQQAINYVKGEGGGEVRIKVGTYNLTAGLILYSNIHLVGEDTLNTVLDFSNWTSGVIDNAGIDALGTEVSTAGTITLTADSTTVSGSSTTFSDDGVVGGNFLSYEGVLYEISSVTNNTTLILVKAYRGKTTSGIAMGIDAAVVQPISNFSVSKMTIKNVDAGVGNTAQGINVENGFSFSITETVIDNCPIGVFLDAPSTYRFENNIVSNTQLTDNGGFQIAGFGASGGGIISGNLIYGGVGHGMAFANITASSQNILLDGNYCLHNKQSGIYIVGSDEMMVRNNYLVRNNRYGIEIGAGTNNSLSGNNFQSNNLGKISDSGTGTRGVWNTWTPTLTVSGGTAPTYTSRFINRFMIDPNGITVHCKIDWLNLSGGTAGAGANGIRFTLPVTIVTNAPTGGGSTIYGSSVCAEAGGTAGVFGIFGTSSTTVGFYTGAAQLAGNDQSSTVRNVGATFSYEI